MSYLLLFNKTTAGVGNVQYNTNDSRSWKCLLEIRDKVANHLQYKIGNGRNICMWIDRWHDNGLLIEKISHRDLYDVRMSKMITIKEMIEEGVWQWPIEWLESGLEVTNIQTLLLNEGTQDKVMWRKDDNSLIPFHVKHVMDNLCSNMEEVRWHEIVWFKRCIPKHSFCLWLAMLGRLLTQDRIMSWGTQTGLLCPLCNEVNDSHYHLFFQCKFSQEIWEMMVCKININKISFKLEDIVVEFLRQKNGNNIWSAVRRLSLAAVVYHIWQERNQRLFRGDIREAKKLFEDICEVIQLKLMSMNVKGSEAVKSVANIWGIQFNKVC